jgi:hypothetical protein
VRPGGRWAWSRRQWRGGCWASGWRRWASVVRVGVERAVKTEVAMSGQLALVTGEGVVAAAVWETLPAEVQRAIAMALARLVARMMEAERDE